MNDSSVACGEVRVGEEVATPYDEERQDEQMPVQNRILFVGSGERALNLSLFALHSPCWVLGTSRTASCHVLSWAIQRLLRRHCHHLRCFRYLLGWLGCRPCCHQMMGCRFSLCFRSWLDPLA